MLPSAPTATVSYFANNQINWVSGIGSGVFLYDAAGDVTQDNLNNYLYDGEGRICAMQNRVVGTMTQYIYDAEGTRVAKGSIASWSCDNSINASTGLPNNGFKATNSYVLDSSGEQVTETDGNGNLDLDMRYGRSPETPLELCAGRFRTDG